MEQIQITVEKLTERARLPEYGSAGAACFDLFATDVAAMRHIQNGNRSELKSITVNTGLKFDIPDGYVMRVYSRSGQGFKNDIRLANCVGIIDSDYTGEVMVKLTSDNGVNTLWGMIDDIKAGKNVAVAQAEICPVEYVSFAFGTVDKDTDRGANGFGSTDAGRNA